MAKHANQPHKRSWQIFWDYFFEFFMLFLAVFCGFLAENFREDLEEHQVEKQYMVTLLEDLKADTAEFAKLTTTCTNLRARTDSVITYMRPPIVKNRVKQYCIESVWVTSMYGFSYNDRTIEQLKSSGAFRLIEKNNVADSIVVYDNKMRDVFSKTYNIMWDHRIKLISMLEEIIDFSFLRRVKSDLANKKVFVTDSFKTDTLSRMQLITNDNEKLMLAYNVSLQQIYISMGLSSWIRRMNTKAINLIHLIQKEYKIE